MNLCKCGETPRLVSYFIKGVANKKNWFVKCDNCRARTRSRNRPMKAIEEWNKYGEELFKKEE